MKVEVFGPGCARCRAVERNAREAAQALGIDVVLEHVSSQADIAARGIMFTPGLAINGEILCKGRIPTVDEIRAWMQERK